MSDRNVAEESEDVDQGGGEETSNSERPDAELDPVDQRDAIEVIESAEEAEDREQLERLMENANSVQTAGSGILADSWEGGAPIARRGVTLGSAFGGGRNRRQRRGPFVLKGR